MPVRRATPEDVPAMTAMIQERRRRLAAVEPVFWHPAANAQASTTGYFGFLVASPTVICLVAEEADEVQGFLIATETRSPPVMDPGGPTWTVDDYAVARDDLWPSAGRALWDAIVAHGRTAKWRQIVCVTALAESSRNTMLREAGLHPASQWWPMTL